MSSQKPLTRQVIKKPVETVDMKKIEDIIKEVIQKELTRLGFLSDTSKVIETSENLNRNDRNELLEDDPMDIDLVRISKIENTKDLLALDGKVNGKDIQILADSCANISFISKMAADELGLKIDTRWKQKLNGASGENMSLGKVTDVLIQLSPGCVIKEDLMVVDYGFREIGLSRTCLRRYNYDIHESRNHIALTCDGVDFFIPIVPDKNRNN